MPSTTPVQGWPVPVTGDDPDVAVDMTNLAKAIEKRVVGVYATVADRDTKTGPVIEDGMFAYVKDVNRFYIYEATAWVDLGTLKDQPAITSGTAAPSGGANGDIYFRV